MENNQSQLCACSLGFASGLIWGLALLVVAWLGMWFGYGAGFIHSLGSIYIGYTATFWGGVIGFIWGFIDVFIALWLVAIIYNRCSRSKSKCCQAD